MYVYGKYFTVYYKDGTDETYEVSGDADSMTGVDCPGYLTYTKTVNVVARATILYYYTYTEAGTTSEEFHFSCPAFAPPPF